LTITPFAGDVVSVNLEAFVKGYLEGLDYTDAAVNGEYVSKVDQVDGVIAVSRTKLPVVDVTAPDGTTIVNADSKKAELSAVTATTIKEAEAECSDNKFATEAAVRKAINALDVNDAAVAGQYVSAVSEVDGKITVTRAALPTESVDVDSLDGATGAITTLKGQTAIGKINLAVVDGQLQAELVGSFADGAQVNTLEGVKLNGVKLTPDAEKLVNVTAIEGIVADDKVLSKNGNNIMSTLSLDYEEQGEGDAKKKYIVLKGIDDVEIDKIDASDFIADSFLDDVEIKKVDGKDTLYFTWSMADGTTKTDSVDLSQYINIYTGAINQIVVSDANVIGLAEHKATPVTGEALTLAHGGDFSVITGVATDDYGRVSSVTTSKVTLPSIADGDKTGSDDYVSVQVKTAAGVVSEVVVNTDALTTEINGIKSEVAENEAVTSAALNDLNDRLIAVEGLDVGVTSVTGETAELNNSAYVSVKAATVEGAVTLTSTVNAVEATDTTTYSSTGLATDGYVNEKVATVSATAATAVQTVQSTGKTIEVTRAENSNVVNLELCWQEGSF